MPLHTPTLFAVIIAVSVVLAAAIAYIGHRRHPDRYLWASALALQALAYSLYAVRGKAPDWLSVVVANTALSASFALYAQGVLRLRQLRWPAAWVWAPVLVVTAGFAVLIQQIDVRLMLGATLFGAQNLLIAFALLYRRQHPLSRGESLMLMGALVVSALMLMRLWATSSGRLAILFVTDGGWIQGITFLAGITATIALALGLIIVSEEQTEQSLQQSERHQAFRNGILEMLARGTPIQSLLDAIVRGIERLHPEMRCSILLLDRQGKHLLVGAAPSLPDFYNAAVHGLAIGHGVGSCGTAAHSGTRVVVEDIAHHPYWVQFRETAAQAGLGACWSEPILSSDQRVLGTFAIYHPTPHTPSADDLSLIEQSALLTGIAIEHSAAAQQLLERERHYRLLFETANEGIAVFQDGVLRLANPRFFELCGYTAEETVGHPFADLVHEDDRDRAMQSVRQRRGSPSSGQQMPLRVVTRDRGVRWFEVNGTPFEWQGQPATLSFMNDITERRQLDETIQRQALHDSLTQLPNRRLLVHNLQLAMGAHKRNGLMGALMFLDLDNFKPLNDTHGHGVGDLLLIEVARRLRQSVREIDTVARFGGDEFVVLLSDLHTDRDTSTEDARTVAHKLLRTLAEPYVLTENPDEDGAKVVTHRCSASIGVILFNGDEVTADELIRQADQAMYGAKQAGRNTVCFGPVTPA